MASHGTLAAGDHIVQNECSEENTPTYNICANASADVTKLVQTDAEDESLRRYKERLLGASTLKGDLGNLADTRRVVLTHFYTVFEDDRPDFVCQPCAEKPAESAAFELKEGSRYRLKILFTVQHEIVSGLRFCLKVKRAMIKRRNEVVMGSYGPRSEPHVFTYPKDEWLEAPKGKLSRGTYKAQLILHDLDGAMHFTFDFSFKIVR